jgi:hypothetical protein
MKAARCDGLAAFAVSGVGGLGDGALAMSFHLAPLTAQTLPFLGLDPPDNSSARRRWEGSSFPTHAGYLARVREDCHHYDRRPQVNIIERILRHDFSRPRQCAAV